MDVEVHDDPSEDDQRARADEEPTRERAAVREHHADAEEQRDERDAEAAPVAAEAPVPVAAVDLDFLEEQIASDDRHAHAEQERAHTSRRTTDVLQVHPPMIPS